MRKAKLVIGFSRYRSAELLAKTRFIIEQLLTNKDFAAFATDVENITKVAEEYAQALTKAESRNKADLTAMHNVREILESLLRALGLKLEAFAGGDELLLLKTGFSLAKERTPVGILPKPENFVASPQAKGMIALSLGAIYGAKSYQYEYRLSGGSTWIVLIRSKASTLLKELTSGAEYEFRVAAVGAAEERIYSDTVRSYIL